jgi:hypothetical protein
MKFEDLKKLVLSAGYDAEADVQFSISDAINTADAPQMLTRIYTEIVQSAVEMQMVGQRLIKTMRFNDVIGNSVAYKWIGAGNVPSSYRAEGAEYPEFSLAVGSTSMIKAQFEQHGYVVKITREQIQQSQWDVITLHITEAAKALARNKEKAIFQLFDSQGVVVFDNDGGPGDSLKGRCNGRDIFGVKNGAITQEDLFDMYCEGLSNGYNPNVILVHPLAFPIFQKDPILRNAGYNMYNPREFINSKLNPINSYKNGTIDTWRNQQRTATGKAQRLSEDEITLTTTGFNSLPSYSPLSGMTVITSHLVPFDRVNQTTSIIMIDTESSGVLNVQAPLTVDSWEEMSREITAVRIKEAYSIDVIDGGLGILVAKNIPLVANEIMLNPQVVINDLTD